MSRHHSQLNACSASIFLLAPRPKRSRTFRNMADWSSRQPPLPSSPCRMIRIIAEPLPMPISPLPTADGPSSFGVYLGGKNHAHFRARAFQSLVGDRGCTDPRKSLLGFAERKSENQNTRVRTQFRLSDHSRRLLCRTGVSEIRGQSSEIRSCRAGIPACRTNRSWQAGFSGSVEPPARRERLPYNLRSSIFSPIRRLLRARGHRPSSITGQTLL